MSSHVDTPKVNVAKLGGPNAWFVCFSAALFFFYEFIQMHMFDAINDALRAAFSVNATGLSFLSSAYLWGDILFLLPAGVLLDRYSIRQSIIVAMIVCIIGTVGFGLSHNFWAAAFFHLLSGIGNAFCFLACVMLVSRWFPANLQAGVIGLVITMAFVGGMIAQTPLAELASRLGWRQALMIDGLLGGGILLLIYFTVEDSPSAKFLVTKSRHNRLLTELKVVFRNPQNWLGGIYTCMLNLPIMVLGALWGSGFLQRVHHLAPISAAHVVESIFVGSIFGAPIAGFLSDRWGYRRRPMLFGALLTLLVMVWLLVVNSPSYKLLLALFFAIGFFSSAQVIVYAMVAESNSKELTGTATGLASVIIMGGAGLAQVLFGQLLDWHWLGTYVDGQRMYAAEDYHFAMMMFPIAFIIGLIAAMFSKETNCRPRVVEDI